MRNEPYERFQSFLRPIAIELFARECVEPVENDHRNGVCSRRGRILKGFAPNFEAAHRRSVFRAIEESSAFGIAEAFHGKPHGTFSLFEVFRVERRFVGIEQGSRSEDLVIERALQTRATDAMQETFGFIPGFRDQAIQCFERELSAIFAAQDARGFEISRNKHRIPSNVDGGVNCGRGMPLAARREQFSFCAS